MSIAIRVEGLGKRYAINSGAPSKSIRDQITRLTQPLFARHTVVPANLQDAATEPAAAEKERAFWALKDVSFDVAEGERIGIIGANGAGKSTLLKILSRVTSPTTGSVAITGRVSSLLEVGTGFHPELSGRENVYLNGAILGMPRAEIRRKFDQIVAFSGVERFIDTPVKHYSSGMYVRLAFSVSAWLDPDILIVDEVLAVGDQAFQKKCAERMKELTKEGRTVLFVSHSMATVNQMCQKALYLENGRVVAFKTVEEATVEYQRDVTEEIEQGPWHRAEFTVPDKNIEIYTERQGEAECLGGSVTNADGAVLTHLPIEQPIHVTLRYRLLRDLPYPAVPSFNFYDENGQIFFVATMEHTGPQAQGDYQFTCVIPPFLFNNQRFMANLNLVSFSQSVKPAHFAAVNALRFEVCEGAAVDPRRHGWSERIPGLIRHRLVWTSAARASDQNF